MNQPSFFDPAGNGRTRVKICGVTAAADAERIVALGADAIGVNFWPKSKRFIAFDDAEAWLRDLGDSIVRIGVFVNASPDEIVKILDSGAVDAAQLHGDESPGLLGDLLDRGHRAFKAVGIRDREMLNGIPEFPGEFILLDAYAPAEYGGTGEKMDWRLGREAADRWPDRKIVLAGGLKPENVSDAVDQARPFGVDVASGVELSPGVKDLEKVSAFIANARK